MRLALCSLHRYHYKKCLSLSGKKKGTKFQHILAQKCRILRKKTVFFIFRCGTGTNLPYRHVALNCQLVLHDVTFRICVTIHCTVYTGQFWTGFRPFPCLPWSYWTERAKERNRSRFRPFSECFLDRALFPCENSRDQMRVDKFVKWEWQRSSNESDKFLKWEWPRSFGAQDRVRK